MRHTRWFFVFKQKTGYELRIREWRSDVCSSDLSAAVAAAPTNVMPADAAAPPARPHAPESVADASPVPVAQLPSTPRHGRRIAFAIVALLLAVLVAAFAWQRRATQEIGRASCRERVC